MQSFFNFLVSVINHYHINVPCALTLEMNILRIVCTFPINGLYLFWDSFEWSCLQLSSDKIFFPLLIKD